MNTNIIITGFGGQGILFAGKILANAAMLAGKHLSWLPSYGPEMRGGTANCHVIIADEPVGSPIITEPDILISMNRPSFDRFEHTVKGGGLIFIDKTLIDREAQRNDVRTLYIPATQTASEMGNSSLANMVMLGALLNATQLFSREEIQCAVEKSVPKAKPELAQLDIQAIFKGYTL